MKTPFTFQDFFRSISVEIRSIPRRGLAYAAVLSLASAALELSGWLHRPEITIADYAGLGLLLIASLAMTYTLVMMMLARPWTLTGLGRFTGTLFLTTLPLLLGIGLLLAAARGHSMLGGLLALLLMLGGGVVLVLSPGWPALQANASRWIGPLEAFRATKGMRAGLLSVSFLSGSLNRLTPDISKAHDLVSACSTALIDGGVSWISLILVAGVAVAAARYMEQADSRLGMTKP